MVIFDGTEVGAKILTWLRLLLAVFKTAIYLLTCDLVTCV